MFKAFKVNVYCLGLGVVYVYIGHHVSCIYPWSACKESQTSIARCLPFIMIRGPVYPYSPTLSFGKETTDLQPLVISITCGNTSHFELMACHWLQWLAQRSTANGLPATNSWPVNPNTATNPTATQHTTQNKCPDVTVNPGIPFCSHNTAIPFILAWGQDKLWYSGITRFLLFPLIQKIKDCMLSTRWTNQYSHFWLNLKSLSNPCRKCVFVECIVFTAECQHPKWLILQWENVIMVCTITKLIE